MRSRTARTRPTTTREAGSALLLALGSMTTLLIAGGALLLSVTQERTATEQSVVMAQAHDVSTSGAQDALATLGLDASYTGHYSLAIGGAVADVTVTAWANNHVDDDGDGAVDETDEANYIGITSAGEANCLYDIGGNLLDVPTRRGRSVTTAIVQKTQLNLSVTQALYVDDPNATFKFSGNAFLISGNDTNINGTPGPNAAKPGIGTVGDPNLIKTQLSSKQKALVIGSGSPPSVATVADVDMSATIATLSVLATKVFNGPDDSYSGALGDFTNRIPIITHAKGNLKLNGSSSGCGILIVDGDVDFNGSIDFAGVLYVTGAVRFNGGGGGKNLRGALLTLGAVTGTDVTINGSVDLRYSSEAMTVINTKLSSGVSLVCWKQQ